MSNEQLKSQIISVCKTLMGGSLLDKPHRLCKRYDRKISSRLSNGHTNTYQVTELGLVVTTYACIRDLKYIKVIVLFCPDYLIAFEHIWPAVKYNSEQPTYELYVSGDTGVFFSHFMFLQLYV